jgi:hypothetical protein
MPAVEQPSNVPREAVYGEGKAIEEQIQGAPLAEEPEAQAIQPVEEPVAEAQVPEGEPAPSTRNLISVLPPDASAPSETYTQPLTPEDTLAKALLALPGVTGGARSLAAQMLGRFTGPGYVGDQLPAAPVATEYDEVGLLPPEEATNA